MLTPDPDARRQLVKHHAEPSRDARAPDSETPRHVGPTHPTNLIRTEEEL